MNKLVKTLLNKQSMRQPVKHEAVSYTHLTLPTNSRV